MFAVTCTAVYNTNTIDIKDRYLAIAYGIKVRKNGMNIRRYRRNMNTARNAVTDLRLTAAAVTVS